MSNTDRDDLLAQIVGDEDDGFDTDDTTVVAETTTDVEDTEVEEEYKLPDDLTDEDSGDTETEEQQKAEETLSETEEEKSETKSTETEESESSEDDLDLRTGFPEDAHGNLLHRGKIIAKVGKERKYFEKLKRHFQDQDRETNRMAHTLRTIVTKGRELQQELNTIKEQKSYGEKLGLTDSENRQAVEIAALTKTDPKSAIKKMLTLVQLNGTDITDLGVDGPLDPTVVAEAAVRKALETNTPKPEPTQDAQVQEATEFLAANPKAKQHIAIIAEAKDRFPDMPYQEIWDRLIEAANKKQNANPKPAPKPETPKTDTTVVKRKRKSVELSPRASFEEIGASVLRDLKEQGL